MCGGHGESGKELKTYDIISEWQKISDSGDSDLS